MGKNGLEPAQLFIHNENTSYYVLYWTNMFVEEESSQSIVYYRYIMPLSQVEGIVYIFEFRSQNRI